MRPFPGSIEGAASGNRQHLLTVLNSFAARLKDLEDKTQSGPLNPLTQAPSNAPPAAAKLQVSSKVGSGLFAISITNPEFIKASLNPQRTPLLHEVSASPSAIFANNVHTFPVSGQTYYEISRLGKTSLYWRIRSSYDGKNWNQFTVQGPVSS